MSKKFDKSSNKPAPVNGNVPYFQPQVNGNVPYFQSQVNGNVPYFQSQVNTIFAPIPVNGLQGNKYGKPLDKSVLYNIEKYNIDITERKNWVVQIIEANPEKKEIEDILKELYPGLSIDINGIDLSKAEELNTAIGLALSKDYLNKKDLLFINEQNEYVCVESYDTFEKAVQNKSIKFNIASDIIPRTIYKGQPESQSNNEITEDDDATI